MVRIDEASGRCAGGPQVGLVRLRGYTHGRWGGDDANEPGPDGLEELGIYACRLNRSGNAWSLHADGRAWDVRFQSRAELDAYFAWLIAHAEELQVQRIIDYEMRRIWESARGWFSKSLPSPGGHAAHVERNWTGARDARAIEEILGPQPPSLPPGVPIDDEESLMFIPRHARPLPGSNWWPCVYLSDDKRELISFATPIEHTGYPHVDGYGYRRIVMPAHTHGHRLVTVESPEGWNQHAAIVKDLDNQHSYTFPFIEEG